MVSIQRTEPMSIADLAARAARCRLCPGMNGRSAVLGPANGPAPARIMFIAEAPGRLGADRTGIPLFGDRSGDNFELLLHNSGLRRGDLFITNAVLCNPRDSLGRNRRPTQSEIINCSRFLKAQIEAVSPAIIVTLGATALRSLNAIDKHHFELAHHAGRPQRWRGATLLPLYHPSPRTQAVRAFKNQLRDFKLLAALALRLP
jgi:uracil-DNA glycosylase family 4